MKIDNFGAWVFSEDSYQSLSAGTAGLPFPAGKFYRYLVNQLVSLSAPYHFLVLPVGDEFFVGLTC